MKEILIVGARGLGKEVLGYLRDDDLYEPVAFLDELDAADVLGLPVVHPERYEGGCRRAVFAVGYPLDKTPTLAKYEALALDWETYVHPQACVSPVATLGRGGLVAPFAAVCGDAVLGDFVFLNVHAAVGHDARLGDRCSLMPHAAVAGEAGLGEGTLLAIGASVLPGVTVGASCRVSAGSVVTAHMPEKSLVFGNPARYQPDLEQHRP
jgi:sugar O-acyltransferase (sialic acid O-acetyltransferase NeuD family)